MKEANTKEGLEKGWTFKYITDLAIPVQYYLRGEEYSAQIDHFVERVQRRKESGINIFEQVLYTDKVIEMIIDNAKLN